MLFSSLAIATETVLLSISSNSSAYLLKGIDFILEHFSDIEFLIILLLLIKNNFS